jgi:hypothetical protein
VAIGIAVRDDLGITHWAPFSETKGRGTDSARAIARQFGRGAPPRLSLACEGWWSGGPRVRQVRRVSTLTRNVTCMACASLL